MSTATEIENEVIRREVTCNGIYVGSITATEEDAIEYFSESWYFLSLGLDFPQVWHAKPILM